MNPVGGCGYKVKRSAPQLTPEERKAKEDLPIRQIAESMRRKLP